MNRQLLNALRSEKRLICMSPRCMGVSSTLQHYVAELALEGNMTIAVMTANFHRSRIWLNAVDSIIASSNANILVTNAYAHTHRYTNSSMIVAYSAHESNAFSHYRFDAIIIDDALQVCNVNAAILRSFVSGHADTRYVIATTSDGLITTSFNDVWDDVMLGEIEFTPIMLSNDVSEALRVGDVFMLVGATYAGIIFTVIECTDDSMRVYMSVGPGASKRRRLKDRVFTALGRCYASGGIDIVASL